MFARFSKAFTILTFIFGFSLSNSLPSFASTDTTPPVIKSSAFDKTTVQPGGQILIQVDEADLESGIDTTYVNIRLKGGGVEHTIFLRYNPSTQKYEG